MSQGLVLGPPAAQRFPNGTTVIPLGGVQVSDGIVVANNRFTMAETGNYWMPVTLAAVGANSDRNYTLELVNVTTGVTVQSLSSLIATVEGDYTTVYMAFNVANPAHEFEFRLTCNDTIALNAITLRANGFFAMPQSYLASSVLSDAIQRTSAGTNFFAAAGTSAYQLAVTGDPNPRLEVFASGEMRWGSGAAAADIVLARNAASSLLLTTTSSPANGQLTFQERGGPGTTTLFMAFLPHTGDATNQPFHIGMENFANVVGPRQNPTVAMGFNFSPGGLVVAGQPGIGLRIEEAFESPAATFLAEFHLEYMTSGGVGLRAFSFAANRATDVLNISSRGDAFSFNRRSDNVQVYNMNLTNGVFSLALSGSQFQKDNNNEHWLTQHNAANTNFIGLIHANAQDIVQLQGQNGLGALSSGNFAVGGSGNTAADLWQAGTNTLFITNGTVPPTTNTFGTLISSQNRIANAPGLSITSGSPAYTVRIGDISNFWRGANVVAAASITPSGNSFHVTGNTNIDTITVASIPDGTVIWLIFDGTPTVGDGTGNLILAGNLVAAANTTLTLMKDGANWIELARSAN